MATRTYTVTVCDMDGAEGNVRHYKLQRDNTRGQGKTRQIDLCPPCAEPLEKLLALNMAKTASPKTVTNLDEEKK